MSVDPVQRKLNKIDNEGIPILLRNVGLISLFLAVMISFIWLREFSFEAVGVVSSYKVTCQEKGYKCVTYIVLHDGTKIDVLGAHEEIVGKVFSKKKWKFKFYLGVNEEDYVFSQYPLLVLWFLAISTLRGWKRYRFKPE